MLEDPGLDPAELAGTLQVAYGIDVTALSFVPGYDLEAASYEVSTPDGSFFLKVRLGAVQQASLDVPRALLEARVPNVLAPIPTRSSALWAAMDWRRLVLQPFVHGRNAMVAGLTDDQWHTFAAGADRVARAVQAQTGLRTVFHPHCGGYVETETEIDQLMARTDPSLVGLCLDTGHTLYGGGDPLAVLERHADRVWHVHFKDCHAGIAAESRELGRGYLAAVRARVFCELGQGAVDFGSVLDALRRVHYDGWIVVEQDVFPGHGAPAESAQRNREYLRALGV